MYSIQFIVNIIISCSLLTLSSFSFSIIYYPTKIFHIAQAAIMAISAYTFFVFYFILAVPLALAFIGGAIIAAVVGVLCESIIYKQMRKRKLTSLAYLIASLGIYIILQNAISLYFGDDAKIINNSEVVVGHQIFGAYITTIQVVTICFSLALFIGVNIFLCFSDTGKSIRAVSSNSALCNIYGISSNRIILIAFAIGSALAGVAGILSAMDTNMTPTFGFNLLLYGVVAMIIGGIGSTRGLLAGSLLVATAQHLAAFYLDTKWMDAVTYIILILFLIWKPLGFSGNRLKKVEV
ncbi:MAG: branched-chain amino acid ABC transporter permease [Eubacteriaceae bacterium]|nr:branched-chain amino acid ABC transporter permease [Eubacteriaceae bacterium]